MMPSPTMVDIPPPLGTNGPLKWLSRYPLSKGKFQSPINIETAKAQFDPFLDQENRLELKYRPLKDFRLINDGTCIKIYPKGHDLEIKGGPLIHPYRLDHFHFHWGSDEQEGSEHRIDGKPYDAEIHFVHWNHKDFKGIAEAAQYFQGLAVLGVLVQTGAENEEFNKVLKYLQFITHYKQEQVIPDMLDITKFIPEDTTKYWTYSGSLTTPPFNESVTWLLLKDPITLSKAQLHELFTLYSSEMCKDGSSKNMCNIFREPQPLNDRIVRKSFV